jgi:hypothetical protein
LDLVSPYLLNKLATVLQRKNPFLAERLKRGLDEAEIRKKLQSVLGAGSIGPLIALYSWRNGTSSAEVALEKASLFPGDVYEFIDLDTALYQFEIIKESARFLGTHTSSSEKYADLADNCFPSFWNGGTGWLAIDVSRSRNNRVVTVDFESERPIQDAYNSCDEFLKDVIRANEENDSLVCFRW